MIRVVGSYDSARGEHCLTMEGHAQYNPGCDIVCAAVSCLLESLIGYLDNREGHVRILERDVRSGAAHLRCICDAPADEAFLMTEIGLRMLERAYPAHISVDMEGGEDILVR